MALVNRITFSLEDYSGDADTMTLFVPATATVGEMTALANAVVAELDPVTGMKILGATVTLQLNITQGSKATAIDKDDRERGGNFRCDAADTVYSHTVRVPGIRATLIDGENIPDAADINDWLTILLDGDATTEPCDAYGNDLEAVSERRVTFRK